MSAQQTIRYSEFGEQTRARWQKLLASSRRDLTTRARTLLQLAIDAYESTGPAVLQVQWLRGCLWICCQQDELARLLDCSERTLRYELERLKELACLQPVQHPSKVNLIAYRIELDKLELLPESHTPDLDEIICAFEESLTEDVAGPIAATVAGPIAATVAGPIAALMTHDHERLIEIRDSEQNKESSIHHVHESELSNLKSQISNPQQSETRRFDQITDMDVVAIAGYAIEKNGELKHASIASRKRVLLEYFEDAFQNNHAVRDDLLQFAALFRCAARLHRKPEGDKLRVNTPASWIRTCWTNRHAKPMARITQDDKAAARELLRFESISSEMASV